MKRSWIKRKPCRIRRVPKVHSDTWYRKECVKVAKIIAKKRDNWTCQYCGKKKGEVVIHGSHVLPEGAYHSMSVEPYNIIALCAQHHLSGANPRMGSSEPSWHSDPLKFATWFEEKWPGRKKELWLMARTIRVENWEKKYNEMKSIYK